MVYLLLRTVYSAGQLAILQDEEGRLTSRWRSQFRTDKLYSEINFVLSRFCEPYFQLFTHVDQLLSAPPSQTLPPNANIQLLGEALLLLVQLFHDLNSQDLPEFFENNMTAFMGDEAAGKEGWLRKYLSWDRPELKGEVGCIQAATRDLTLWLISRRTTKRRAHFRRLERPYARSQNFTRKNTARTGPND